MLVLAPFATSGAPWRAGVTRDSWITTGTFTADAKAEATRDGAPPLDLIDGTRLCQLLKEYGLGVQTTLRTVEDVQVIEGFFQREFGETRSSAG